MSLAICITICSDMILQQINHHHCTMLPFMSQAKSEDTASYENHTLRIRKEIQDQVHAFIGDVLKSCLLRRVFALCLLLKTSCLNLLVSICNSMKGFFSMHSFSPSSILCLLMTAFTAADLFSSCCR